IRGSPACSRLTAPFGVLGSVLFLCAVPILYALPASPEKESTPHLKVALVQGNISWDQKLFSSFRDYAEVAFQTYARLTLQAADPRLVLIPWPSPSMPMPGTMLGGGMFVRRLARLVQETGTFVLVGSDGYDKFSPEQGQGQERRLGNSAF